MPDRDLRLGLRLTADGKGFVGEVRVARRELDRLTGSEKRTSDAARDASRSQRDLGRSTRSAGDAAARAEKQTKGFGAALLSVHGRAISYGLALTGIGSAGFAVQRFGPIDIVMLAL